MKFTLKKILLASLLLLPLGSVSAESESVEEARIDSAEKSIPNSIKPFKDLSIFFSGLWPKVDSYEDAVSLIDFYGSSLWQKAKQNIKDNVSYDDRGLYWARLMLSKQIRTIQPAFELDDTHKLALLERLEKTSRGIHDLEYRHKTDKRILLTGFDPFFLDRNIDQSNPSGAVAILLDGMIIEHKGITAEINTFVVPVRYGDFDQGLIEETLAPVYALNKVDMVTTVSMGRENFDLERFPGKRRSAAAPGNLNIYTGASKENPIIANLYNAPLPGPEFVEFSLPVKAMLQAKGQFEINDNHQVTTLEKTFKPATINELSGATAVSGSGGGYLSNEISYRSIRLRNELSSTIPTGHIHTPRIKQFEPETNQAIVEQVIKMLELALPEL